MNIYYILIGLFLVLLMLLVAAFLALAASVNLQKVNGFSSSTNLKNANWYLVTSYVLGFITAGIILLILIIYAFWSFSYTEPGSLLFTYWSIRLLIFACIIMVGLMALFGGLASSNIPSIGNNTTVRNYTIASVVLAIISTLFLLFIFIAALWYGPEMVVVEPIPVKPVCPGSNCLPPPPVVPMARAPVPVSAPYAYPGLVPGMPPCSVPGQCSYTGLPTQQ